MATNNDKRGRHWFFTFNNYEVKDIDTLTQGFKNEDYTFQEEVGKQGTPHLQGVVSFKNARTFTQVTKIDKRIHWEICKNINAAENYCKKLDTRAGKVYTNKKNSQRKIIKDPLDGLTLQDFQIEILDLLNEEPNDRTVKWIWDEDGGKGKTSLAKHMILHHPDKVLRLDGACTDQNAKYLVAEFIEKNDLQIIIIDYPRGTTRFNYDLIEDLKNGFFTSTKYECKNVVMNCPHVVVFSNTHPDLSKLSEDRWDLSWL